MSFFLTKSNVFMKHNENINDTHIKYKALDCTKPYYSTTILITSKTHLFNSTT